MDLREKFSERARGAYMWTPEKPSEISGMEFDQRMARALLRVLDLHKPEWTEDQVEMCLQCPTVWPCPTVRSDLRDHGGKVTEVYACPKPARQGRSRNKYSARPQRCRVGVMHQSTSEARRCDELHLMQQGGLIHDLKAHPQERFSLDVNGVHVCHYLADFVYFDVERGEKVVEDVKGYQTDVSKFKLRLMEAVHGIRVELVRRSQ